MTLKDHRLVASPRFEHIRYERRPARDLDGGEVPDLFDVWIWLNNPAQLNSYTTATLGELILAFREASTDRAAVAVVLTAVGDKAFCSGGNTKEYAEYYAGNPGEYKQYMRLFNDTITGILTCDKPVINRVNGLRVGGGQEIGMACDFSIASDLARFGQAGPRHGSAPDGGSTDFLHLYVGFAHAIESCALCEPWSAYKALRLGLVNQVVPVLVRDGRFVPNPLVVTDRWVDEHGMIVYGELVPAERAAAAKAALAACQTDLSGLDQAVATWSAKLLNTMPDCLNKTIESMRKKKLEHWQRNCETNRSWLALNMMTEARAGFRAFNEGPPGHREVDFAELRRRLARGDRWDDELTNAIQPKVESVEGRNEEDAMVRSETRRDGGHLRLIIDEPKSNLITIAVMQALRGALAGVRESPQIKLVTIEGAGDHFSYGASVEEHRPEGIRAALGELHELIRDLLQVPAPTAALVRGRCLGGGFEVALACDLMFAGTTAMLGVPEIALGVFPPAAATLLPMRIGSTRAASAILTGRTAPVDVWAAAGLIELTAPAQELGAAVDHWFDAHLAPRSATALRCAALATRATMRRQVDAVLPELEHFYLDTLMRTKDAVEGIEAFLEKRPAVWSHA